MTSTSVIWRREFHRGNDEEPFRDVEADPDFATKNFVDFFGKTWIPNHPNAFSLDDVLRPFYEDSQNEATGIYFRVFAVADGSLVQHTDENKDWLSQRLRFITIVAGNEKGDSAEPFKLGFWTLCIVGSDELKDQDDFLQVASWDGTRFRYYSRERVDDYMEPKQQTVQRRWVFQGDSTLAFGEQSYMGPFNGHVNGSLVMKELHKPWLHWLVAGNGFLNRMSSDTLKKFDSFPYLSDSEDSNPNQQRSASGELSKVEGADVLERIITTGVNRWYNSRRQIDFMTNNKPRASVQNVKRWLAHLLLTTTVNIGAGLLNQSGTRPGNNFDIPISHFYNVDVFGNTASAGVKPTVSLINALTFDDKAYGIAIDQLGLALVSPYPTSGTKPDPNKHPSIGEVPTTGESDAMFLVQVGEGEDTFFSMLQPSYEDTQAIGILLTMKPPLLSKNCIYAMLMVDPYNPIYSWRRGVLMQYIPDTASLSAPADPSNPSPTPQTYDLEPKIEAAIRASPRFTNEPTSPEREFITHLEAQRTNTSNFPTTMNDYLVKVMDRLRTQPAEALLDYLTLAESRRRLYRPVPLDEFALTLPWAVNYKHDRPFEMTQDGTIVPVPDRGKRFFEQWIGSLASSDPQMIPRPDADDASDNGVATMAVFASHGETPAVLNIACHAASTPVGRLGGGCPYMKRRTNRQLEGQ